MSYSQNFFQSKLNLYELMYSKNAPGPVVHEAKVLLKFLEDIRDEGYEDSYACIDESCDTVTRLKLFIAANNEKPFDMRKYAANSVVQYASCEYDLGSYLNLLEQEMGTSKLSFDSVPDIFYDILSYSKSIFDSSNEETAYCFLLRDTLLPYLAFKKWTVTSQHLNIVP